MEQELKATKITLFHSQITIWITLYRRWGRIQLGSPPAPIAQHQDHPQP